MKKILYSIIIFFAFLGLTNAEKCTVVTGSGKNIGDEIACGTEHFYVTSNDGKNVKMLAKYNLLVGTTVEKITFDEYEGTEYSDIYKSTLVQEKIKSGYSLHNNLYDYNDETEKYKFYGAIMYKNLDEDSTAIFFEEPKLNKQEAITSKEAKETFEKGYKFRWAITNSDGKIIGLEFEKDEGYEYKTIVFDKIKNINFQELYNLAEVKYYLENNYAVYTEYYNNDFCDSSNIYCTEDFYGIVLYKSYDKEFYNIISDKVFTTTTEVEKYLEKNEEYQKKLKEGYTTSDSYCNREYLYGTTKYLRPFGIILSKDTGKTLEKNVYQDENAIGAHGDERGNPDPIEIAITYLTWQLNHNDDGNIDLTGSNVENFLSQYKKTLASQGYKTKDIYLLTLEDLLHVLAEINGVDEEWDKLDLDWDWEYINGAYRASMLNVIPDKYSWIYSTTYWTASDNGENSVYFIDTLGDLCSTSGWCNVDHEIGAGIRPLVTISANDLEYQVETKTDGHGQITPSKSTADDGEEITFTITPDKGYVLKEIKVTDADGNTVTFTENKFTMPSSNVLIEATFIIENPETTTINIILSIIMFAISFGIILKFKKNADWLNT